MYAVTIAGSGMSMSQVDYATRRRHDENIEEMANPDRNAGQNPPVPYFAELRRMRAQEAESEAQRMAQDDPLGRGKVFDFVA